MSDHVVFVGFSEQDNLGIGYVASMLLERGFQPVIVDFEHGADVIRNEILQFQPVLVGFSIIFQYHIYQFRDLIAELRAAGIRCHFTAGGHYPSLRHEELLEVIPQLDSVVRFEGEYTCLELAEAIRDGRDWRHIAGIAYANGQVVSNELRPLETELDVFPPPVRPPLREYVFGKKYATLLAGRGCLYNCSFCSIRQFYSAPPGPLKRLRRAEMVVQEMRLLHEQRGCSIFMFQDDDFPLAGATGREWSGTFCELLRENGLNKRILFKVNCRPDEIERDLFAELQSCGLFLVYLGIECGTDEGLKRMNKHLTAEASARGVRLLDELGIAWDFGFMLFEPGSTHASVLANIDFLERICGGSSPVTFCKMLPYAETAIEKTLLEEGRLRGRLGFQDYSFRDESLDYFYNFLIDAFDGWIGARDGVLNLARWARYRCAVARKYFPERADVGAAEERVRDLVRDSNEYFFRTVRECSPHFAAWDFDRAWWQAKQEEIEQECIAFKQLFQDAIDEVSQAVTARAATV